jgi:RimJ/RimL family protein N-acetyltransferase
MPHITLRPARTVLLRDGSSVVLRPVEPEDRERIAAAFEQLSPTSRFLRFHAPTPRYSRRLLEFLATVDDVDHGAVLALDGDRCVGIGRFVRLREDPAVAEVALTVVDDHQGRGLGRSLIEELLVAAAARGIATLQWVVHPGNHRAMALMSRLGIEIRLQDGVLLGLQAVPAARPATTVAA